MKLNKKYSSNKPVIEDDTEDYEQPRYWYNEVAKDPKKFPKSTEQVLIELKDEAKTCHNAEVANYNIKKSRTKSNYQWMKTVMSKGTVSDKIAAYTISIQDNPVCSLDTIRNLVGMVKVNKNREFVAVLNTLSELFLSDLLKPGEKLKTFDQRPLSLLNDLCSGNALTRRKLLSIWYFEDQLKAIYGLFVQSLNAVAHDTVDSNKEKAISVMYKLLAGHPDQEQTLLKFIVNKLGDPSQKIASKVIYCLLQLLNTHLKMQEVVLSEIEKLLFRTNISSRAQYYSLCFLSQYYLSHESGNVARKLIEVYLSFFKACVKKGDINSRMMSALLTGINRAYPYAEIESEKFSEHIDTMYRLVHLANFNIGLHALTLLYQVSNFSDGVTDRFHSALYRKLLDPALLSTTHKAMFLSLVYKALLKDNETRVKAFIKRLLQISLNTQPSFTCGILYMISQLMGKKKKLLALDLIGCDTSPSANGCPEVETVEIKEEPEDAEVKQENEEQFAQSSVLTSNTAIEIKEEDIKPNIDELEASIKKEKPSPTKYDPLARNPSFAGGLFCVYSELHILRNHFHPTVSLFAAKILGGETVVYSGDPLNDFELIRFMDRFVFKNPKMVRERGEVNATFAKRKLLRPRGVKLLAVKSVSYLKEDAKNIPVDEVFLHSYLQRKYQERELKEEDSDVESVESEQFEEMLNKLSGVQDDIDFMEEIGDSLHKNKEKGKKDQNEGRSDEENEDEDQDISDEEISDLGDSDDQELLADLSDEDDDEDMEFLDDEAPVKSKISKHGKKKKKGASSLFASADEFATLLEEEGTSKVKPGGSNVFSNKDNANVKQLAWEENRNRWMKGFDKFVGGKKRKSFGSREDKSSRQRGQNSAGGRRKKIKK